MTIFMTTYRHDEVGELTIASDGEAIVGLWMEGQKYFGSGLPQPFERRDDLPVFEQARGWLDRYFAGGRPDPLELPLAPRGTAFQRRVWGILARIPFGGLRTYADIAEQIAREDAEPSDGAFPDGYEPSRNGVARRGGARAVGTANGRNPISIILPCHRVVGSNGSLTGYAGGIERKLWLLRHEGVDVSRLVIPKRGTAL